ENRGIEAEVVISEYRPVDAKFLNRATRLRGIVAYGVGYNHIDIEAAAARGVVVCNARGANAEAVAELTVALMLNLSRSIHRADVWVRTGGWTTTQGPQLPPWLKGWQLHGRTLGIVGFGETGRRVAAICRHGFGMKVLIAKRASVNRECARELSAKVVDMNSLFRLSDVVSLHVPLTEETSGLVGRRLINLMKPSAILINTSRGEIVNHNDLTDALRNRRIAAAGLDVFPTEPIQSSDPLLKLDNILLSPHVAGFTQEAMETMAATVVDQVRSVLQGRRPRHCILP
ncbi:MAG: 2-hydroxyacid dehydrogenase, partial [Candidatus Bathyarchaeia archaeon]